MYFSVQLKTIFKYFSETRPITDKFASGIKTNNIKINRATMINENRYEKMLN